MALTLFELTRGVFALHFCFSNPIRGGVKSNLFRAGGSQIWPFANFHPNIDILGQNRSKFNFQQLLFSFFMAMSKSHFLDHFCTTNLLSVFLYYPYIEWKGGGKIWSLLKIEFSDLQKWSKKWFFWRSEPNKICKKLQFEWFWPKKSTFGWKLMIWGEGVRSALSPARMCCGKKSSQKSVKEGSINSNRNFILYGESFLSPLV